MNKNTKKLKRHEKSRFDQINDDIPEKLTSREDIVLYMIENGSYTMKGESIDFNDLCNHTDDRIMDMAENNKLCAASSVWYNMAAENEIYGLLTTARAISTGHPFKIRKPKIMEDET